MSIIITKAKITFAEKANRFIYTLKNLPFLGSRISEEWYIRRDVKKCLGTIAMIFAFIKVLFFCFLFYLSFSILPAFFYSDVLGVPFSLQCVISFLGMNGLLGTFVNSRIFNVTKDDYCMVNLMHMDARFHYLSKMISWHVLQFVCYFMFVLVTLLISKDFYFLNFLLVFIIYAGCRPIGEAFSIRRYLETNSKKFFKDIVRIVYVSIVFLVTYALCPVMELLQKNGKLSETITFAQRGKVTIVLLAAAVIIGAIGILSTKYLLKFRGYLSIERQICNNAALQENTVEKSGSNNAAAVLDKQKYKKEELSRELFINREGYDYLNALFFFRHKKLVKNFVKTKVIIVGALFLVAATGLMLLSVIVPSEKFMEYSHGFWKNVSLVIGILVIVMYCASSGRSITNAMFYNCDISLLKYGYYRKPDVILKNFKIRLGYMIRMEIPMALVMMAGMLLNIILLRQISHIGMVIAILICICILSVFYSVVFLCLYYIFQPYTEGGSVTGFGYKFSTFLIYFISYMCTQVHIPFWTLTSMICIVTVVVLAVSFGVAYKVAPKTFHLK